MKVKRKVIIPLIPMVIHKDLDEAFEAIYKDLKEKKLTNEPPSDRCRHPKAWVVNTRLGGRVCFACGEDDPVSAVNAPARPDAADGGN